MVFRSVLLSLALWHLYCYLLTYGNLILVLADKSKDSVDSSCEDCRLTSSSIEYLIRKPRQIDSRGQVSERIDLEKIPKVICREIFNDQERERCRAFYFNNIDTIKEWKQSHSKKSFFDYICIIKLKYCCPENSFGPKCKKCPQCAQNEHCQGEGTRTGSGNCTCKAGHTGPKCATCLPGYYMDKAVLRLPDSSSKKVICKPCHKSCKYCHAADSIGCDVCNDGFTHIPRYGCSDIDECMHNKSICGQNTFCVNTEGSYFCYECDRACDGCHADGPDACIRCARGYFLEKGNCVTNQVVGVVPQEAHYIRYWVYAGLCICVAILVSNNIYLSAVIGLCVAVYISASEYIMSNHPTAPANQDWSEPKRTFSSIDRFEM